MRPARSLRDFLIGPGAYAIGSPWSPVTATIATLTIFVASQAMAAGLSAWFFQKHAGLATFGTAPGSGKPPTDQAAATAVMTLLCLTQASIVALTLLAAVRGGARAVLKLVHPPEGWGVVGWAMLVMIVLLAIFNGVALILDPDSLKADFAFFRDLARSDAYGLTFLGIGIGAPLSEELLFRGFLLTALAATRLGYVASALITTLVWTGLHWGYSVVGLVEVFGIGLYFSWLLWRTGSLWVPILCHAIYNSALFLVLRFIAS